MGKNNSLRAQYIELFATDANSFPDDILRAHFELAPPAINAAGIVIHAGISTAVSPGSLVDIYGINLAAAVASAAPGPALPLTLGNIQVMVNGKAAPLIYVSPLQVIFQMP